MSELDDKIIIAVMGKPLPEGMPKPNFVENIMQAFADAGYVQMAYNPTDQTVAGKPIADVLKTDDTHMTGQEWYERFKETLENWIFVNDYDRSTGSGKEIIDREQVLEAAQRAAGIQQESN